MSARWNGSSEPPKRDSLGGGKETERYTLTKAGFLATLPRGACGHYICSTRDECAWAGQGVGR